MASRSGRHKYYHRLPNTYKNCVATSSCCPLCHAMHCCQRPGPKKPRNPVSVHGGHAGQGQRTCNFDTNRRERGA
eukprot:4389336-Prorocentrum_lima.AAC.1